MALAYTELTEELGRLQALSSLQKDILRKASQEQASPGEHRLGEIHTDSYPILFGIITKKSSLTLSTVTLA